MKIIKYWQDVSYKTENGENAPILLEYECHCSDVEFEKVYSVVLEMAVGEITVEDIEDPVTEPTQLDQIEAQVAYTAMMTNTLLEEV